MSFADRLKIASLGPRTNPIRAFLSSLGVAIGIAVLIALVSIPISQNAELSAELRARGANLLVVRPGSGLRDDEPVPLPVTAPDMVDRLQPVSSSFAVSSISWSAYRSDLVPPEETQGVSVASAVGNPLATFDVAMKEGCWFCGAASEFPTVVVGVEAAMRLGVSTGMRIWVEGAWWGVSGVLSPISLAEELDYSVFIARDAGIYVPDNPVFDVIYVSTFPGTTESVKRVLPATVNPENPYGVTVSDLSDFLKAQELVTSSFQSLLYGLGAVALLVGGVGIANTMVVSVMERRGEIGVRRALGATVGHIVSQFVLEACLLGAGGGVAGVGTGAFMTHLYCLASAMGTLVPAWLFVAGPVVAVVTGALAGLYPAVQAARQPPTVALRAV